MQTLTRSLQENTHRLTLSMSPDESYLEKQAQAEEEKLQKKIQALSDGDRKEIYDKGKKHYFSFTHFTNILILFFFYVRRNSPEKSFEFFLFLFIFFSETFQTFCDFFIFFYLRNNALKILKNVLFMSSPEIQEKKCQNILKFQKNF